MSKENGSTSADKIYYSISNRFLENQPNEICSHLSEKMSKGRFLKPENGSKITVTKEKERRKRKSDRGDQERRRRKKSNGCTLSFYNELLWIQVLAEKKLFDGKGPLDDNVFKNPARYIQLNMCYYCQEQKMFVVKRTGEY